jgi:polyisoprenoid-binding protein YceI
LTQEKYTDLKLSEKPTIRWIGEEVGVKLEFKNLAKAQSRYNKQTPAKAGGNSKINRSNFNAARF